MLGVCYGFFSHGPSKILKSTCLYGNGLVVRYHVSHLVILVICLLNKQLLQSQVKKHSKREKREMSRDKRRKRKGGKS